MAIQEDISSPISFVNSLIVIPFLTFLSTDCILLTIFSCLASVRYARIVTEFSTNSRKTSCLEGQNSDLSSLI